MTSGDSTDRLTRATRRLGDAPRPGAPSRARPTAQDAQKARFLADMFEQLARPAGESAATAAAAPDDPGSARAGAGGPAPPPGAAGMLPDAQRIVRLARFHAPWLRELADRIDAMVARGSGHPGA